MLTTNELRSPLFNRITKGPPPRLSHPTAKAFDFDIWRAALAEIPEEDLGDRDLDLAMAAQYLGGCLAGIRRDLVAKLFEGLSSDQIVELAVANANRAWNIFRWHVHAAMPNSGNDTYYTATLGQAGIPIGPGGALVNPADANNALIDALPYWFAEAADAGAESKDLDNQAAAEVMLGGHGVTNLMQAFKSVWQEVLWEPWTFRYDDAVAELSPAKPDDLARWHAWGWRDQSLAGQASLLNRNLEKDAKEIALALPLTAVGITKDGITTGPPTKIAAALHRSAFETLQKSYAVDFLEEPIGEGGLLTVMLLESAVCVLQDLTHLCFPAGVDPAGLDDGAPLQFNAAFPRPQLSALLAETLAITPEVAEAALSALSSDPFGELGPLFNVGLWHRPLVRSRDSSILYVAAGALMWGAPVRRVERWLQIDDDWTDTPAGIRYEAALRGALAQIIEENELLADVPTGVASIARGAEAKEEVDLVLRIGDTVILGEVKCLLGPSEPIERHNYVRKLEAACGQAARKASWLEDNRHQLVGRFGADAEGCRIVPLVVVNQSSGVEWEYEGVVITDARFLELFVGSGSIIFSGKLFSKPGEAPEMLTRTMYASAAEAETAIPDIFRNIPGMDPFRSSIAWSQNVLPMPEGRELRLAVPVQDADAYIAAMADLIAEAE